MPRSTPSGYWGDHPPHNSKCNPPYYWPRNPRSGSSVSCVLAKSLVVRLQLLICRRYLVTKTLKQSYKQMPTMHSIASTDSPHSGTYRCYVHPLQLCSSTHTEQHRAIHRQRDHHLTRRHHTGVQPMCTVMPKHSDGCLLQET